MTFEEKVEEMLRAHLIAKGSHDWVDYTIAKMVFNEEFGWVTRKEYAIFIDIVTEWIGL